MIELQGITKSFGTLQVLKGIDLMIEKGEVVSIVGPSGAGKTTLLQIMGTLDKADTGTILLNGTEVSCLKEKELSAFRNRQIGFVFQFYDLIPELTAKENILLPSKLAKKGKTDISDTVKKLGVENLLGRYPAQLSGGQQQRVLLARALCATGKLLLLDEPVSGLDPMVTAEMYEIISRLNREQGITIIMISHDLQGALKYGTKILHMESGAYFFGTTAEYRSTDIFHAMSTCDCHCTCDHHTGSKEAR